MVCGLWKYNISYPVTTSQCPVLLLPTYLMRCISRRIYNSRSTLRWFKLFIAIVKVNHRNVLFYLPYSFILKPIATLYVYYDVKNEIYPRPPTCIFWKKIESFYYCYNLYIYIIYLIGLNLCPTLCLILCPFFLILKNIKSLIYRVMSSLNTLDFVSDFVSHFVSHFVSDKYRREILETDT